MKVEQAERATPCTYDEFIDERNGGGGGGFEAEVYLLCDPK